MTCQEMAVHIDAFLDDELSVMENLRVQAHLVFCQECRRIVESETRLRGLIEADSLADAAPAHLRDRILRLTGEQAPPGPTLPVGPVVARVRRFRMGALAVAVSLAVALAVTTYLANVPSSDLSPLVAEVFAKHRIYSRGPETLQVATQNPSELGPWLGGRVGFPIKLPVLARPGERLLGGRLSSIADAPAAYLLYEREGRRVSLFIFRGLPRPVVPGRSVTVEGVQFSTASVQGKPVVWWEDGEVYYAAAADGGLDDLIEFGLLCVRARASPVSARDRPPSASQPAMRPGGEG